MPLSLAEEFRRLGFKQFVIHSFAGVLKRVLRPFGCTVWPTEELDGLRRHHAELFKTVEALKPLKRLLGEETDQHPDYQLIMAQQSVMASFDDLDPAFPPIAASVKPFTMTSIERQYDLYKSVEYIAKAKIPGDLLECGVWRGGSMMLAAKVLVALGDTSRRLYLFDTYEGHPKPHEEHDVDLWGNRAVEDWKKHRKTDETSDWAYVSIDEVRANMASTGYPMDKVVLVKGMVEKTAPDTPADALALVRLDTDWYDSAKIGLETFWPRISRKGILIIDDYGHYRGQRKAVDEFFADSPVKLHRIDYSCRTVVKTE